MGPDVAARLWSQRATAPMALETATRSKCCCGLSRRAAARNELARVRPWPRTATAKRPEKRPHSRREKGRP
eukprot:9531480-Alexandrium_andersonii.AAC.1